MVVVAVLVDEDLLLVATLEGEVSAAAVVVSFLWNAKKGTRIIRTTVTPNTTLGPLLQMGRVPFIATMASSVIRKQVGQRDGSGFFQFHNRSSVRVSVRAGSTRDSSRDTSILKLAT